MKDVLFWVDVEAKRTLKDSGLANTVYYNHRKRKLCNYSEGFSHW